MTRASAEYAALDGPSNMRADLEMLSSSEAALRVYMWDGPWVSLGRYQRPERDIVPGFEKWVIRPTGGKAVLHGHDVTVALAMPFSSGPHAVQTAFRLASEPLVLALERCGLDAVLAEEMPVRRGTRTADCFAFTSGYDVVSRVSGAKVCGCALLLSGSMLLLQASIPYKEPLIDPASAIVGGRSSPVPSWDHERLGEEMAKTCATMIERREA